MKKLTAEEFATKVMENGTELEPETETKILVYAHINDDGELVHSCSHAEWSIYSPIEMDSSEEAAKLCDGDLDDLEREYIISDLYPQYCEIIDENF